MDAIGGNDVNTGLSWGQALATNTALVAGPLSAVNGTPTDPVYVLYEAGGYGAFSLTGRNDIVLLGSVGPGTPVPRKPADSRFNSPTTAAVRLTDSSGIHLRSLDLTGNSPANGGGLLLDGAGGTVATADGILIQNSVAATGGGGFYVDTGSDLRIDNSVISANTAPDGGGGMVLGALTMTNCNIGGNIATGAVDGGGGLLLRNSLPITVTDSVISGNYAEENGGGLMLDLVTADQTIKNNLIVGNANNNSDGGGLHGGDINVGPTIVIESNTIAWNQSLANNRGGGILLTNRFDTGATRNNILWFNDDGTLGVDANDSFFDQSASGPIEFNNIELDPTAGANNNQGVDPLFESGFYLNPGSPSVNAGSMTAAAAGLGAPYTTDVSGSGDAGTLDQGYHHDGADIGAADNAALVKFGCAVPGELEVQFMPNLFVSGMGTVNIGPGHLVAVRIAPSDLSGAVIDDRSSVTYLQPDGAGSRLAVDLGNDAYRISAFDFAVSPATVDIALVIDGVNSGIVVQSPPLNTIPGC